MSVLGQKNPFQTVSESRRRIRSKTKKKPTQKKIPGRHLHVYNSIFFRFPSKALFSSDCSDCDWDKDLIGIKFLLYIILKVDNNFNWDRDLGWD